MRNPFRIAVDPNEARFFINDVGEGDWEEIDEGESGADYGWNKREGPCKRGSTTNCDPPPASAGLTDPIFAYEHGTGCQSITGGAFVPDGIGWGAQFDGAYFYTDFVCDTIFILTEDGSDWTSAAFGEAANGPVSMTFGPFDSTQALYYTSLNGDEVRVIHPDV